MDLRHGSMTQALRFTGERFLPGVEGPIAYEHWHRYAFARAFVPNAIVVDVACGEGYGTALLAECATVAIGIDVDEQTINHARKRYRHAERLQFVRGAAQALPLPDTSVDALVSFETVEHISESLQRAMIDECARVLKDDGLLVMSSPNRKKYSDERNYANPFHVRELYRTEFEELLRRRFETLEWYDQAPIVASAIWSETRRDRGETWWLHEQQVERATAPDGLYYIVVAAKRPGAIGLGPHVSLLHDRGEVERRRLESSVAEVSRLDALLKERTQALDYKTWHVEHLEKLAQEHEQVAARREEELNRTRDVLAAAQEALGRQEASISQLAHEVQRLQAMLDDQQQSLRYYQTWRGWLRLPLTQLKSRGRTPLG